MFLVYCEGMPHVIDLSKRKNPDIVEENIKRQLKIKEYNNKMRNGRKFDLPDGIKESELDFSPDGTECTDCGACCQVINGEAPNEIAYVELLHGDLVNLRLSKDSPFVMESRPRSLNSSGFSLKAVRSEDKGPCVCVFLSDSVGVGAECTVYNNRPSICRSFEKGSQTCIQKRKQAFFNGSLSIAPRYRPESNSLKDIKNPPELLNEYIDPPEDEEDPNVPMFNYAGVKKDSQDL